MRNIINKEEKPKSAFARRRAFPAATTRYSGLDDKVCNIAAAVILEVVVAYFLEKYTKKISNERIKKNESINMR